MYEDILDMWRRESSNKELQPVEVDLYPKLRDYISRLKKSEADVSEKSITRHLQNLEIKNALMLIGKILDIRYEKILESSKSARRLNVEKILAEEEEMIKSLKDSVEKLSQLKNSLLGSNTSIDEGKGAPSIDIVMIRFLKDMPKIVSTDMKYYGPFKSEDVSNLPRESAETLVEKGLAIRIDIS